MIPLIAKLLVLKKQNGRNGDTWFLSENEQKIWTQNISDETEQKHTRVWYTGTLKEFPS